MGLKHLSMGKKIGTIQETASTSIAESRGISSVIGKVNEVIIGIASAVDEQSIAAREIVNNIVLASRGFGEVSENVSTTSSVASGISQSIEEASRSTTRIAENSLQVRTSSNELSSLAEQLTSMVSRFNT